MKRLRLVPAFQLAIANRVNPGLGSAPSRGLPVLQPVSKPHGVKERDVIHRLAPHVGFGGVFRPTGGSRVERNPAPCIRLHAGVVHVVWIRPRRVHGVQEVGVLVVGDLVLADAVGIRHGTELTVAIILVGTVAQVSDRGPIQR